jgi:predicted dehydrogenase
MVRVGIVGCGPIATSHHSPGFLAIPGVEIVAVCDVDEAKAKALGEKLSAQVFTDIDAMLGSTDLDIVDVATSEGPRPPLLLKALQAGKHVFTEKPLAGAKGQYHIQLSDIPQLYPIIDEWQKQGTKFGINFNLRQSDNVRTLKETINSGHLGDPDVLIAATHMGSTNHVIDLLRWINGEVDEVSAVWRGNPGHPTRAVQMTYANGSIGTFVNSMETDLFFQVNYLGSKGRAIVQDICGDLELRIRDGVAGWDFEWSQNWKPKPTSPQTYTGLFAQSIAQFVRAVRGETNQYASGLDGLRHMEIDAAMTESAKTGVPVRVQRYEVG